MSVKTYNAADVDVIFNGHVVSGKADGTFVTIARNNQSWNLAVGSDGEGARAKSNDKSGTVTVTVMQSSITNDLFSGFSLADELNGDGVGALLVKDRSGRTLCAAETAWIQKPADAAFAREIESREWVIETDALDMFVGGN